MKDKVKFVFSCDEKSSADLKIRLRYDELSQNLFFCTIMELYIAGDPVMLPVVEKIKYQKTTTGKRRLVKWKKEKIEGTTLLEELGVTDSDKQKIFDIIEDRLEDIYE